MQASSGNVMQNTREVYFYPRRALMLTALYRHPSGPSQEVAGTGAPVSGGGPGPGSSSFDANVVMILAVLLCALICALGLNSIVRCALRCSSRMAAGPTELNSVTRLAQNGLKRKALRDIPTLVYSARLRLHAANPVCAICLADFEPGERVRVLPKCNHGFHVRCVDRWLLTRSTCPTCRQSMAGAPQKAESGPDRSFLVPLGHERLISPYDF